jgi:hypothetical protein
MTKEFPRWAMTAATPQDRERAEQALRLGRMQIEWPDRKAIRDWARQQGWPAPWFGFDESFIKTMLESDRNFELALNKSGIKVLIPLKHYIVSDEELRELDALYQERDASGRPASWGALVAGLRELRRAAGAGVVIEIEGETFKSSGSFYTWVHGRYHALEDGYDDWVGIDD